MRKLLTTKVDTNWLRLKLELDYLILAGGLKLYLKKEILVYVFFYEFRKCFKNTQFV